MDTLPTSDQLDLWEAELNAQPWGGRSPRALTAGYARFTLKAQAVKSVGADFVDEDQHDLWLPIKNAPWKYQGAPLLKELTHGA